MDFLRRNRLWLYATIATIVSENVVVTNAQRSKLQKKQKTAAMAERRAINRYFDDLVPAAIAEEQRTSTPFHRSITARKERARTGKSNSLADLRLPSKSTTSSEKIQRSHPSHIMSVRYLCWRKWEKVMKLSDQYIEG